MGDLGAILGASWAVLSRRKAEKKQMPKSFNNLRTISDMGLGSRSTAPLVRSRGLGLKPALPPAPPGSPQAQAAYV